MMRALSTGLLWTAAILACFCPEKTEGYPTTTDGWNTIFPCRNGAATTTPSTTMTSSTTPSNIREAATTPSTTTMTSSTTPSTTTMTSSTTPSTTTMTSSTTPSTTTMTSSTTPSTTTMTSSTTPSTTTMTSSTTPSTTTMTSLSTTSSSTTWSTTYWPTWWSSSTFSSTTGPCATTSTPTSTNGRPQFRSLQAVYPTYAAYPADAQKLKTDMGLPDWLFANGTPNTCAIRMSKTFHDAGLGIDRGSVTACATRSARVNGNGRQYIIRALFFQCYLRALWGQPDVTGIKKAEDINCHQGVIIFTGCSGFGQHIDLWDGTSCSMGCNYFSSCSSIELYSLP